MLAFNSSALNLGGVFADPGRASAELGWVHAAARWTSLVGLVAFCRRLVAAAPRVLDDAAPVAGEATPPPVPEALDPATAAFGQIEAGRVRRPDSSGPPDAQDIPEWVGQVNSRRPYGVGPARSAEHPEPAAAHASWRLRAPSAVSNRT